MKWHIRLTQQYIGYMFRSKLEAIIRLIMMYEGSSSSPGATTPIGGCILQPSSGL